jgi:hypothetical protein
LSVDFLNHKSTWKNNFHFGPGTKDAKMLVAEALFAEMLIAEELFAEMVEWSEYHPGAMT